jgi:hypothetical protein
MQSSQPAASVNLRWWDPFLMRSRAAQFLCLGLTLLLVVGPLPAQDLQPTEYQIKAAFLFNFAKFVQWPPGGFAAPNSPIVIGVLGDNPFHNDLERTIQNKLVDYHPLLIREFHSPAEATNCQILFISASEKKQLPEILKILRGSSILTVSETEGFVEAGGIINFMQAGTKLRFQINQESATKAGLKISSKLLSLAWRPEG